MKMFTKIGDVFSVEISSATKKYFQYIANDRSQLNSDVIRVFKKEYLLEAIPDINDIIEDEIDFYAHCVTKWGIKLGVWKKMSNSPNVGKLNVWFRDTNDAGSKPGEKIQISHRWYVWKINEAFHRIGELTGDYRNAEIGVVLTPYDIVDRMKTGQYNFFYPGFE